MLQISLYSSAFQFNISCKLIFRSKRTFHTRYLAAWFYVSPLQNIEQKQFRMIWNQKIETVTLVNVYFFFWFLLFRNLCFKNNFLFFNLLLLFRLALKINLSTGLQIRFVLGCFSLCKICSLFFLLSLFVCVIYIKIKTKRNECNNFFFKCINSKGEKN